MELKQLEILVAAAEERTMRQAAIRLGCSERAVNTAIRALEAEVKIPLFEQSREKELYLTDAGEALVDYARRLLALRDEALVAVAEVRDGKDALLKSFGQAQ